jgi:hypothetical protein
MGKLDSTCTAPTQRAHFEDAVLAHLALRHDVAVQVDPFESKVLKPGNHTFQVQGVQPSALPSYGLNWIQRVQPHYDDAVLRVQARRRGSVRYVHLDLSLQAGSPFYSLSCDERLLLFAVLAVFIHRAHLQVFRRRSRAFESWVG